MLSWIRQNTEKKVRFLIASHSAGDHVTGAWHFREHDPLFIATKNVVQDLFMQEGAEFAERQQSDDPRY